MAYKGTDLNLRSSRGWTGREPAGVEENGSNGWSHATRGGPSEPIPVDDAVLACCNGAYDAAQFHGAAQVRLEHLLHAMTRVRAATELMEQLGIRTSQLRQETAVAIASEPPASAEERRGLHTSGEVEQAVRRAASLAAERKAPASVGDLLRTMLEPGRKAPATAFLLRATTDSAALERWRENGWRESSAADVQARAARANLADGLFKRLDGVEAALRALQAEIAADREALKAAFAERPEPLPAVTPEHLHQLGETLHDRMGQSLAALEDKLDDKLGQRLAVIGKMPDGDNLAFLGARLEVVEKQLGKLGPEVVDAVSNTLLDHLVKAEEEKQQGGTPDVEAESQALERLAAVEHNVGAHLKRSDEMSKAHDHALSEIYEALVKLGNNQQTLASNLNTWRVESSGDISIISNRLMEMERTAQEALSHLDGQVQLLRPTTGGTNFAEQQHHQAGGFKRWLYGTTSVLSGAWRDDPDSVRKGLPTAAKAQPADADAKDKPEDEAIVTVKPADGDRPAAPKKA